MPKIAGGSRARNELANLLWPWANLIRWQVLFRQMEQYQKHRKAYGELLADWKHKGGADLERLASVEWQNCEQHHVSILTLLDQLHGIEERLTALAPELLGKFPRFTTSQLPTDKKIETYAAAMGVIRGKLLAKSATASKDGKPTDGTEGLNRKEAAAFLGLSERKLWSLTAGGEVPHIRIGKRVLYPTSALRVYLAQRTKGGEA